jgi:integrase
MKGHMRERSGAWELRVYAGRDPRTGRKRYVSRTVRGGKREAQRTLAALVVSVGRELSAPEGPVTVGELVEKWFAHAKADFSPKPALETRRYLDRAIIPQLGDRPLRRLRTSELDAFYRDLRAGGGRGGRVLAPATVRRIHGIVHRALAQGVRWGWLAQNPAAMVSPPKVPPPRIEPHTILRSSAGNSRKRCQRVRNVILGMPTSHLASPGLPRRPAGLG